MAKAKKAPSVLGKLELVSSLPHKGGLQVIHKTSVAGNEIIRCVTTSEKGKKTTEWYKGSGKKQSTITALLKVLKLPAIKK